jgi:hypothetical protein
MNRWPWLLIAIGTAACNATPAPDAPITLESRAVGHGESLRLADQRVLPDGSPADLTLYQAMMLSLRSPQARSICTKGTFAALADIPTDLGSCPADLGGEWTQHAYLSGSYQHTAAQSTITGLGLLVRDQAQTLFRVRVLGDSYSADGVARVVLEAERVP